MELREKLSNFGYYNKNDFHCSTQSLVVSPKAPFNWKLLPIGIVSVEGIWKNVPNLQVVGSCPVPPMPPVIRIVLLQYRGNGLRLLQLHCINRFYENAWLGFSHYSEIFWKALLAFIGLFSQILGLVHLNLWCPFYVRNFSKFWVKVSIYIWVLSQLMGWIFVLWFFNDNPRNSVYFPRPMT